MVARRVRQGLGVGRREVGQGVAFEMTPEHLDRIEVRSVGRQEVMMQLAIALEELGDDLGSVGLRAVPNDEKRLLELTAQAPQEPHHPACREVGVGEQGKVKSYPLPARRDRDGRNGGNLLMPSPAVEKNRRSAARSPRPTDQRSHQKAAFVYEYDVGVQSAGFFLRHDQSSLIHFCTAFSSRSRARFSGFCGVHPNERNSRGI